MTARTTGDVPVPQCAGSLCLGEAVWIIGPQEWAGVRTGQESEVRAFSPVLGQTWQKGSWPGPEVSQDQGLRSVTLDGGAYLEPGAAGAHPVLGWLGPGARRVSLTMVGICASPSSEAGGSLPSPSVTRRESVQAAWPQEGWQR